MSFRLRKASRSAPSSPPGAMRLSFRYSVRSFVTVSTSRGYEAALGADGAEAEDEAAILRRLNEVIAELDPDIIEGLVRGILNAVEELKADASKQAVGKFMDEFYSLPPGTGFMPNAWSMRR